MSPGRRYHAQSVVWRSLSGAIVCDQCLPQISDDLEDEINAEIQYIASDLGLHKAIPIGLDLRCDQCGVHVAHPKTVSQVTGEKISADMADLADGRARQTRIGESTRNLPVFDTSNATHRIGRAVGPVLAALDRRGARLRAAGLDDTRVSHACNEYLNAIVHGHGTRGSRRDGSIQRGKNLKTSQNVRLGGRITSAIIANSRIHNRQAEASDRRLGWTIADKPPYRDLDHEYSFFVESWNKAKNARSRDKVRKEAFVWCQENKYSWNTLKNQFTRKKGNKTKNF